VSDERIEKIARKFQRDMEKLGLGVKIKAGDGPWRTIVEDPAKQAATNDGEREGAGR
jgi:hypothetical protein